MNERTRKKLPRTLEYIETLLLLREREQRKCCRDGYFEGGAAAEKQQQLHAALAFSQRKEDKS
jgi:hypothetical protein